VVAATARAATMVPTAVERQSRPPAVGDRSCTDPA
jgi:hypothetical protein